MQNLLLLSARARRIGTKIGSGTSKPSKLKMRQHPFGYGMM
jgi:hypothetical protein